MNKIIYIQLLGEGTKVYRPVPAFEIEANVFEIQGYEIYDPDDEEWEFEPGVQVIVEEHFLNGEAVLLAVKNIQIKSCRFASKWHIAERPYKLGML